MIKQFFQGAEFAIDGFKDIRRAKLLPYIIIPVAINVVVFTLAIYWLWGLFDVWIDQVMNYLPSWLEWLDVLLWPMVVALLVLMVFFGFTVVANFIAAPFNGFLAEKLEEDLRGGGINAGKKSLVDHLANFSSMLINELKKLVYQIAWMIPLIIISLIPVVNLIAPLLWAIYGAWMLAIQYADYPMGNHDYFFKDERKVLGSNRSLSLGFGGMMSLITIIPVVNFIAVPVGVCGATRMWVSQLSKQMD